MNRFIAILAVLLMPLGLACAPPAPSTPTAQTTPTRVDGASQPASTVVAGAPSRGGLLRIGVSQEPIALNPFLGRQTVGDLVSQNILEGLTRSRPDGGYEPLLAAEVPTQQNGGISADGLTITWRLKPGLLWSDGKPLTSKDLLFTHDVSMNPANPIVVRAGYTDIESIKAPDDVTVVIKYKQLYAPYKGAFPWVLPAHAFNGDTLIDKKDFNRAPLGSGPFKFKSWASGDNISLERNPNYRETDKPNLDGLIFKIVPSREAAVQAFKTGEIDVLWNLIEANIPEFQAMPDAVIDPTPSDSVERLILNTSCPSGPRQGDPRCPHPVLGDLQVRQAIELAIDKQAIVDKLLFGKAAVASSVIPLGWYAPTLPPSEYDPSKARQLLDQAGWQPGQDGIRLRDGVRARLEYGTTTGDRLREQTQQLLQEQLRAIGIEVELKNAPSEVLLGSWQDNAPRARGNFDLLQWTTNAGTDPQVHLYSYFHSSQVPTDQTRGGRNYHRVLDLDLDRLLDAAGATVDEASRKAAYQTVAERVNADKGHIVLYNRLRIEAFKRYVRGHTTNVWSELTWDSAGWWLEK